MPIAAAAVLLACIVLTLVILRGRAGRRDEPYERDPQLDEALERMRTLVRRPGVVIGGAIVIALLLIAALARNPSRWAVLLLALGVLATAVTAYVVAERRRRSQ